MAVGKILFFFFLFSSISICQVYTVTQVTGNRSFRVDNGKESFDVYLNGVTAHPAHKSYMDSSKIYLEVMLEGKQVFLHEHPPHLGDIKFCDVFTLGGNWINWTLLYMGYLKVTDAFPQTNFYYVAEAQAGISKRGIWSIDQFVPKNVITETIVPVSEVQNEYSRDRNNVPDNKEIKKEEKQKIRTKVQCKATTKKGKQCSRMTDDLSGYCWQHKK